MVFKVPSNPNYDKLKLKFSEDFQFPYWYTNTDFSFSVLRGWSDFIYIQRSALKGIKTTLAQVLKR